MGPFHYSASLKQTLASVRTDTYCLKTDSLMFKLVQQSIFSNYENTTLFRSHAIVCIVSKESHFLLLEKLKNSTTSGQFSRKCFPSTSCQQLEMLRNRLTAESGGLGRRLFDHGWVSSETSFSHFLTCPPTYSLYFYQSNFSFFDFSSSHTSIMLPVGTPKAPRQEVAVLHSGDEWVC